MVERKFNDNQLTLAAQQIGLKYKISLEEHLSGKLVHKDQLGPVPTQDWNKLAEEYYQYRVGIINLATVVVDAEYERDSQSLPESEIYRRLYLTNLQVTSWSEFWESSATQYLLADIIRYKVKQVRDQSTRLSVPAEVSSLFTALQIKRGLLQDPLFDHLIVPPYWELIKQIIVGKIPLLPASSKVRNKNLATVKRLFLPSSGSLQ